MGLIGDLLLSFMRETAKRGEQINEKGLKHQGLSDDKRQELQEKADYCREYRISIEERQKEKKNSCDN